jgi:uncharacterized membrane protein
MGLALLVLGLILFLGPHVLVTRRGARAALVARIVGLYFIAKGFALYRDAGMIEIWDPPEWTRHITVALMWPAVVFFTAAYIPGDIKRVLKHPMLVGVKLWAVAHLISNGDLGSMIIFIAVLAWAVYDRITLKRRSDPGSPPIPVGGRRNDVAAVIVGTILYFALALVFHPLVIGKPVLLFGPRALGT